MRADEKKLICLRPEKNIFHISKCVRLNILYLHKYIYAKVYIQTHLETIKFYCTVLQLYLFGKKGGGALKKTAA